MAQRETNEISKLGVKPWWETKSSLPSRLFSFCQSLVFPSDGDFNFLLHRAVSLSNRVSLSETPMKWNLVFPSDGDLNFFLHKAISLLDRVSLSKTPMKWNLVFTSDGTLTFCYKEQQVLRTMFHSAKHQWNEVWSLHPTELELFLKCHKNYHDEKG